MCNIFRKKNCLKKKITKNLKKKNPEHFKRKDIIKFLILITDDDPPIGKEVNAKCSLVPGLIYI